MKKKLLYYSRYKITLRVLDLCSEKSSSPVSVIWFFMRTATVLPTITEIDFQFRQRFELVWFFCEIFKPTYASIFSERFIFLFLIEYLWACLKKKKQVYRALINEK